MGQREAERVGQLLIHRLKPSGKQIPKDFTGGEGKFGGNRAKKTINLGSTTVFSGEKLPKLKMQEDVEEADGYKNMKGQRKCGGREEEIQNMWRT